MDKKRITAILLEVGACWAIRDDKFCDPNDPIEAQMEEKKTYHVHPNQSYPHQNSIIRFGSLKAIAEWCKEQQEYQKIQESESTGINISQARAIRLAKTHEVYLCPETGFWIQATKFTPEIYLTGDKLETIPSTAFKWMPDYDPEEMEG